MNLKPFNAIIFLMLTCLLMSFDANKFPEDENDTFTVVLDAGHGGHDPGNLGNGYLEKDIALNIVLKVGALLEKHPDIKVIYTRKDDTFVDLYVRGEIANKANADLFVSVHCDSHNSDARGAGTFVLGLHANKQNFEIAKKENSVIYLEDNYETRYAEYDINSPESVIGLTIMQEEFLDQSIMLAKMMQDNFSNGLKRIDRKVKQAGFIVLHQTFMPSVLVETGFLTYRPEGMYLNSGKGQSEMGKAIADAIIEYKKTVRANVSAPVSEAIVEKTPPAKEPVQKQTESSIKEEVVSVEKETESSDVSETTTNPTKENPIEEGNGEDVVITAKKEQPEKQVIEKPRNETKIPSTETAGKDQKPKAKIIFKVQLLASSKDLPLRPEDFKGLNSLSKEPYKNLFRYMYGNTESLIQAKLFKSNADAKGYTSSYIVAYKDGVRIPMPEALKYVSE